MEEVLGRRDPAFVASVVPVVEQALRYFDPTVEGFEHLPGHGPFLVVGNHSGGIYMPDFWAFLCRWVRERGAEAELYALGFDLMFSIPGVRSLAPRIGVVPASHENAVRLVDTGAPLIVYPGGDAEDYRPWTQRHRVDLRGRTGFVRLALRHGLPVVPLVSHGSHDVMMVLARGERLAHLLGLERLRINVFPVVVGPPWGIATMPFPVWPLPAKVSVRVGEPIDWSEHGPEAADDPIVVRHCYEQVLGRMQADLDDLVARTRHPVASRLATAAGLDRLRARHAGARAG